MPTTLRPATAAMQLVDDYFATPIEALQAAVVPFVVELDACLEHGAVSLPRLDELAEPYSQQLRALPRPQVFGAGFVAARGMFRDDSGHLAWWKGTPARKLVLAAESVQKEHLDYSSFEWFRVPAETGLPHIVGPYVDYLCNDEYSLTISVPVQVRRGFAGVMALDVVMATAERDLLPGLRALGEPLVVVNRSGRVLLSSDPSVASGDVVREAASEYGASGFGVVRA